MTPWHGLSLSVWLSDTNLRPAKTAEQNKVQFQLRLLGAQQTLYKMGRDLYGEGSGFDATVTKLVWPFL